MTPVTASAARAMRLRSAGVRLEDVEIALRAPREHEVLIEVRACGVCRTDLHLADGELPAASYPITPGHEIVGCVRERGAAVTQFQAGERVGVPWLAGTCGECAHCRAGAENLCERAAFTGCTVDGGYATHVIADARFCLRIPQQYADAEAAPLLCAGLIGHRAYRKCGDARRLGLYGFGAAAHLLTQLAVVEGRSVFAFTRPGDEAAQDFARQLGAAWAGGSDQPAPQQLDAAILFAPVGALVPAGLRALRRGGKLVCAGIHMSDIPSFPYALLWGERSIESVANLSRADGHEFMETAARVRLRPEVETFDLAQANEALERLRGGSLRGAAVLTMTRGPAS